MTTQKDIEATTMTEQGSATKNDRQRLQDDCDNLFKHEPNDMDTDTRVIAFALVKQLIEQIFTVSR